MKNRLFHVGFSLGERNGLKSLQYANGRFCWKIHYGAGYQDLSISINVLSYEVFHVKQY